MKLQNIVVGCDGSPDSTAAVEAAADLAAWSGATVHAVAASDPHDEDRIRRLTASLPEEYRTTYDSGAHEREVLIDAARAIERRDVTCETHQPQGDPAGAVLAVAEEVDADLIVVGSRGLARGTRHIRGSVSTKIASHAECSFLVLHGDGGP